MGLKSMCRNSKRVPAMKVDTVKNIADMMKKCPSATVRERKYKVITPSHFNVKLLIRAPRYSS